MGIMNPATESSALPNLTADILSDPQMPVDNRLACLWKTMKKVWSAPTR